ncbi:MAG TPA: protein kinase, partial [Myxococcota bacterium]|nr:protein kinase [Myxococcota bacterium]
MRHCQFCLAEVADDALTCPTDHAETLASAEAARARSLLGRTAGSYLVERPLARGGMGEVYEARHPAIGRRVAVKVLAPECARNHEVVERFFTEARAVNVIGHENIVQIIDLASLPDGRPFLVMELLEGESLGARLRRTGPLPLDTLGEILIPVLDALAAAHALGIVHRDLKPDNVFLVRRRGRIEPKVLDFGIAKLTERAGGAPALATGTGLLLGTPVYMAPEQAAGRVREIDARSDVYAAGVILFEMCCGQPPFDSEGFGEILVAHITQPPPAPRSLRPDLPEGVERVILRALAKTRDERWPSAVAMAEALRAALLEAGVAESDLPRLTPESDRRAPGSTTPYMAASSGPPPRAASSGPMAFAATSSGPVSFQPAPPLTSPSAAAPPMSPPGPGTVNRAAAEVMTPLPSLRPRAWRWVAAAAALLVLGAAAAAWLTLGPGHGDAGDDAADPSRRPSHPRAAHDARPPAPAPEAPSAAPSSAPAATAPA